MYWPIGTPRIHATSSSRSSAFKFFVSHDGLTSPSDSSLTPSPGPSSSSQPRGPLDALDSPPLPTPITPGIRPVEHDDFPASQPPQVSDNTEPGGIPIKDPILALRVSRTGNLFAVITTTSITVWQTKPAVILAVVIRSDYSLQTYGKNVDLLLRPDAAILVIHTDQGYLITYSLATDSDSRVYKPHFANYSNVQRRRQSLIGSLTGLPPDQILWGAGEGPGVRDLSVRFRMVIKVDAGIESALALDDELMVSTRKPAAVQCIRWTPDSTGSQTRTEIISRMGWVEKKATIVQMTHDRPMNLLTWITSSGRAYAVQRYNHRAETSQADDPDAKRLFKGHCFHIPQGESDRAITAVINARFSLIAVGCCDGTVQVYSVRDYAGNIPHSHTHQVPVSTASSGAFTTLSYSPDGYCLFAGFEKGWSTWSMFGKLGSHSFGSEETTSRANGEEWLSGIAGATWVGGGSEILMTARKHEAIWSLEMAKNAVTGCYNDANVFRTVLQTPSSVMVYRGYDVPDLTSISAEPFLWHTAKMPPTYLLNQWPIRQTVISPDGRYVAVAGRRGLAHYSVNSGRWKTFASESMENEFQVRGGMCWHQHILVAAVEANRKFELRLFSRETALDPAQILHTQTIPAPVVLVTTSGEDSLLVYTYENLLYHFIFTPHGGSIRLIQVGQIAFHGIVRSPARVRGLSWILPDTQLTDGDPSQDVAVASVIFLVDGKLVLLRPSLNDDGQLKYDMRVIAQNVEYHASVRDQPLRNANRQLEDNPLRNGPPALKDSLWVFDGMELKAWPDISEVLDATGENGKESPSPVSIPVDFYPLSILLEKGIILGVESDLVQRRDVNFSYFHFAIRSYSSFFSTPSMMDDYVSESDSDYTSYWRDWFISSRGNEYFCEIDEDYLTDRFNLTGLNTEVQYYQYALDLVTDVFDLECDDEMREAIEKSARHLYGLVHARYIVTTRGLSKMLDKYKKAEFGKCPRVMCHSHPLLPMGLSDVPNLKPVKLYCARCEDIYNPKSSRHAAIDGAYFGTSFHNILFQVYPALIPTKSVDRYVPRVYGFKVHASAALIRWQSSKRDEMRRRLRKLEIDTGFRDEMEDEEDDDDEELEFEGIDGRMAVVEGL
ncbi:Casein kinase II subunit beta-2 [Fusarium culmorum]|uniref:Casein kinase II subunit beta-2 n=2 Tax=Fusarium sambucinum species complex TaxID=569360 RepID=A0A2T4H7V1_FUSCU|nr:Casein kinase II subunit beta-2 [Fusarium culmorum]